MAEVWAQAVGASTSSIVLSVAFAIAVVTVLTARAAGIEPIDGVAGPFMCGFAVVALILALRSVVNSRLDRQTRYAWGWIAAGFLVLIASFLAFAVVSIGANELAFPTSGDYLRTVFVPLVLVGLLRLPGHPGAAGLSVKTTLDLAMAVTGGAMLLWYLVLGPVLANTTQPAYVTAVAAAYPIADLALITGAMIVTRRSPGSARRPATLLAAALVAMVGGDVYLSYQRVNLGTGRYEVWQFLCWITSCYLMAMAADARRKTPEATGFRLNGPVPYLSYAGVGIGYGLLLFVAVDQPLYPYGGLVYGALIATILVGARSILSLRENFRLAMTDSLTGLANRTRFHDRLTRALERSRRSDAPVAILMLDLDDFKSVNDRLGHGAGDAMLVTVAEAIEKCGRGADTKARLGGDEFAVLLIDSGASEATALAQRLAAAISTPVTIAGKRLMPRASIGVAVSGPGCESASDLLHCADASMYRAKYAARRHNNAETPPDRRRSGLLGHGAQGQDAVGRRLVRRSYSRRFGLSGASPVVTPAGLPDGRVRS